MATDRTLSGHVVTRVPVIVRRTSELTGVEHKMMLSVDLEDLKEFESGSRRCIQNVFPYLNAEEREFLLTGSTAQEWNDLFNDCED